MQIREPEEPLLSPTESWGNKNQYTSNSTTGESESKDIVSNTDDDDDSDIENVQSLMDLIGIRTDTEPSRIVMEPQFSEVLEDSSGRNSVADCQTAQWKPEELIKKFITLFVDEGDVQMAVHIILTVRDILDISSLPLEQYFDAYIEQLRQLQLHTEATTILHLSKLDSVQQSQDNTFTSLSCDNCGDQILVPSKKRGKCNNCLRLVFQCSICRTRVDGPYIWCSWCCHGGHLQCMDGKILIN